MGIQHSKATSRHSVSQMHLFNSIFLTFKKKGFRYFECIHLVEYQLILFKKCDEVDLKKLLKNFVAELKVPNDVLFVILQRSFHYIIIL